MPTRTSVSDITKSKKIKLYLNGFGHCYNFTVNPREFKGWNALLRYFTDVLNPSFGSITRIMALSTMTLIEGFNQLDPDETYVALGVYCKFKQPQGGYGKASQRDFLQNKLCIKKYYKGELDPEALPFLKETEKKHLTVVFLVVNGRTYQCPQKVILTRCDLKRWNITQNYLAKILDVADGVQNVSTVFGKVLQHPRELQHGFPYVVIAANRQFIEMDYLGLFTEECGFKKGLFANISGISIKEDERVEQSEKNIQQKDNNGIENSVKEMAIQKQAEGLEKNEGTSDPVQKSEEQENGKTNIDIHACHQNIYINPCSCTADCSCQVNPCTPSKQILPK